MSAHADETDEPLAIIKYLSTGQEFKADALGRVDKIKNQPI